MFFLTARPMPITSTHINHFRRPTLSTKDSQHDKSGKEKQ